MVVLYGAGSDEGDKKSAVFGCISLHVANRASAWQSSSFLAILVPSLPSHTLRRNQGTAEVGWQRVRTWLGKKDAPSLTRSKEDTGMLCGQSLGALPVRYGSGFGIILLDLVRIDSKEGSMGYATCQEGVRFWHYCVRLGEKLSYRGYAGSHSERHALAR